MVSCHMRQVSLEPLDVLWELLCELHWTNGMEAWEGGKHTFHKEPGGQATLCHIEQLIQESPELMDVGIRLYSSTVHPSPSHS